MVRVLGRLVACVVLVLTAGLLVHAQPATADDPYVAYGPTPTEGTPVPGSYLVAGLGTWSKSPDPATYTFQWLRDGVAIPGATERQYLVPATDIGHRIAVYVTNTVGAETAHLTSDGVLVRKLTAKLTLDVRRVHPSPTKRRLVWAAVTFLTTERPWSTDGGTITAYKRKDGALKQLGSSVITRGAGLVKLPWKRAPFGRTKVLVCFQGSDVVAVSCSPYDVVRRHR